MKKIIITGGTGYIGSHTVVEFINAGYEPIIIDNLSNSNINVLDGIEKITGKRPTFYKADVTDSFAMDKYSTKTMMLLLSFILLPARLLANRYRNLFCTTATTSTGLSTCWK